MARFSQNSSSNNSSSALNYVQVAGAQQIISSAPNSIIDLNITTTGKPVQISVTGEGANASADSWVRINLFRDGVAIGNEMQLEASAESENVPYAINFIDNVAAGTYNYSARVTTIAGGSWTFGEASGPVMNAVELTGFEGDRGPRGFRGTDALWNFTGAYDLGASYAIGDVATYEGQTWYRTDANGGNTGDTPVEGDFWTLIAQGGNAEIADFVFDNINEGSESRITIHNHDMVIRTTRDDTEDADIEINSADDIWMTANDEIEISSITDSVSIFTNDFDTRWEFNTDGGLTFPDGTTQTTAYVAPETEIIPLPDFLTYATGRNHLPALNTNFGWNSDGVYFGPTSQGGDGHSYPVFTDFTINETTPVRVELEVVVAEDCADAGIAFYVDGTTPEWFWGSANSTRISAQFNCLNAELSGINSFTGLGENSPLTGPGTYLVVINYTPGEGVVFDYGTQFNQLGALSLAESLPTGNYRIGFASDNDSNDDEGDASNNRTYIKNLTITLAPGTVDEVIYTDTLMNGNSAANTVVADLVIPVAVKDENNDDFLTITRTNTGTARIDAPQDDLSLRSAADITLFAGTDGPGHVYIGWGDAEYTPNSPNRVATMGDLQDNHGDFVFNNNELSIDGGSMFLKATNGDGDLGAELSLNPNDGYASLRGYSSPNTNTFTTSDWPGDATWSSYGEGGSQVVITGAPGLVTYINDTFNQGLNQFISINESAWFKYDGSSGNPNDITVYTVTGAPGSPTVVTSLAFKYQNRSVVEVDYDEGDLNIVGDGLTLRMRSNEDIVINSGDDIDVNAVDQIRFYTNTNSSNYQWRMNAEGGFEFPGSGYIENPIASSGDGEGLDTFKIVPDGTSVGNGSHQYLIIDPTGPNHIHIRAGGQQDNSNADLILGAERTHVKTSDTYGQVDIKTKRQNTSYYYQNINGDSNNILAVSGDVSFIVPNANFTVLVSGTPHLITGVEYVSEAQVTEITVASATFTPNESYTVIKTNGENVWQFDTEGFLNGPGEDGALVLGGELVTENMNMSIRSNQQALVLNGALGEFLGSSDDAGSQIATIGDIDTAVGVGGNGEVTRWSPNFQATGLTFTGSGATHPTYNSHYVKNGRMVTFFIEIDMATVTNFGTGQYKTELPFAPLAGTMNHFQSWCLVDEAANPDNAGHAILQADHLANTSVLDLHYIKQSGGANSPVMEALFKQGSPVTLTTATHVYINGTYITAE